MPCPSLEAWPWLQSQTLVALLNVPPWRCAKHELPANPWGDSKTHKTRDQKFPWPITESVLWMQRAREAERRRQHWNSHRSTIHDLYRLWSGWFIHWWTQISRTPKLLGFPYEPWAKCKPSICINPWCCGTLSKKFQDIHILFLAVDQTTHHNVLNINSCVAIYSSSAL